jgi:hypothetical protein
MYNFLTPEVDFWVLLDTHYELQALLQIYCFKKINLAIEYNPAHD